MGRWPSHYGAALGIGILVLAAIAAVSILAHISESALPVGHAGEGMYLFEEECAACHGTFGEGAGNGPTLLTADLKPPSVTRDHLAGVIQDGSGTMPGFEGLTRREQADVIAYMISLQAYEGL